MDCCGRLRRVSWAPGKATSSDTMWVGMLKFLEFTERVVHSRSWARFESAGQGGRVPLGGLDWLDWLGGLRWVGLLGLVVSVDPWGWHSYDTWVQWVSFTLQKRIMPRRT